jgi:hypothetical protein
MIGLMLASCVDPHSVAGPNAVQHLAEGQAVDIPSAFAETRSAVPFTDQFHLILPGHRAAFRVSGPRPTFLSIYPSPAIRLFRLERGDKLDDRNLKARGSAGGWRILRDVEVELEVSREGDGLYRVTPRGPLAPGEYAFMSQVDYERFIKYPNKAKLYSFGVD